MTSYKHFEQLLAERTKTLNNIRATIERIRYLIDVIAEQIKLEQQWRGSYSEIAIYREADGTLGLLA